MNETSPAFRALLAILTDRPVAYHPVLARIAGSVAAGILLSQFVYWTPRADADGWFWKTQAELEAETALSRREQEGARRALRGIGVLDEQRRGVPAKLYFHIDLGVLTTLLSEAPIGDDPTIKDGAFRHTGMALSAIQDVRFPPSIPYTEITSEITSESSGTTAPKSAKTTQTDARIDDAFVQEMVAKYGPLLGGPDGVRERIEEAAAYPRKKAVNQRLAVRGWLRRDAEEAAARAARVAPARNGHANPAIHSRLAMDSGLTEDELEEEWHYGVTEAGLRRERRARGELGPWVPWTIEDDHAIAKANGRKTTW